MTRFADQRAHLHGHDVAWRDIGQSLPFPAAGGGADDLDAVGESSLDLVTALSADAASRLLAVDEELRRLARALIGRHREIEVLPAVSVEVAYLTEPDKPAIGGDQGVRGQAAGRREQRGLGVAVAVGLAEVDALLPGVVGQVEDLALDRADRADLLAGVRVLADDPLVRLGVACVAVVRADGRG